MKGKQILHGIFGGLAGGVLFGMMMGMMGMLPMIGKMMGHPYAWFGFLAHLFISAFIGASFAVLFGRRAAAGPGGGLRYGLLYGGIWWLLGPLTMMPLLMGMGLGVNWHFAAATKMMPSLMGHLIYGAVLGLSYGLLQARQATCACEVAAAPKISAIRN